MVLGMTHGELGLVLFIFALVYFAQLVPRVGEWLGTKLARPKGAGPKGAGPMGAGPMGDR